MYPKYPLLIVIAGPTAVGKSDIAIKLAQYLNTEIISSDSRQFYKELNIGVAKLNENERKGIKHHLIGTKSIMKDYNINDFQQDFKDISKKNFEKNNLCILCGGSGLYIDSVCKGFDEIPNVPNEIRDNLNNKLKINGIEELCLELKDIDPISYDKIDLKNPRRVIRALEVYKHTNKPYSQYLNKVKEKKEFKTLYILINEQREKLYVKINKRVDNMIKKGLVQEVKELYNYKNKRALNSIGYTEIFKHLNGEYSLESAIDLIKRNSRRYAKRQITWFKKNNYIEIENNFEKLKKIVDKNIKAA